ncbi:hypothetical protein ACFQ7F_30860 [Streptomyces sp. NPDC056486]|uniref:hypothetical protein n=1 Tax=Streptomyces sp. NPDC056486 TaxID=3345835 RepID=UPI00369FEC82
MAIIWDDQFELPCVQHDSSNPHHPHPLPPAPQPFTAPTVGAGPPVAGDVRAAGAESC